MVAGTKLFLCRFVLHFGTLNLCRGKKLKFSVHSGWESLFQIRPVIRLNCLVCKDAGLSCDSHINLLDHFDDLIRRVFKDSTKEKEGEVLGKW